MPDTGSPKIRTQAHHQKMQGTPGGSKNCLRTKRRVLVAVLGE